MSWYIIVAIGLFWIYDAISTIKLWQETKTIRKNPDVKILRYKSLGVTVISTIFFFSIMIYYKFLQ